MIQCDGKVFFSLDVLAWHTHKKKHSNSGNVTCIIYAISLQSTPTWAVENEKNLEKKNTGKSAATTRQMKLFPFFCVCLDVKHKPKNIFCLPFEALLTRSCWHSEQTKKPEISFLPTTSPSLSWSRHSKNLWQVRVLLLYAISRFGETIIIDINDANMLEKKQHVSMQTSRRPCQENRKGMRGWMKKVIISFHFFSCSELLWSLLRQHHIQRTIFRREHKVQTIKIVNRHARIPLKIILSLRHNRQIINNKVSSIYSPSKATLALRSSFRHAFTLFRY